MAYDGSFNFKLFFSELKKAQLENKPYYYNFENYDNWVYDDLLEVDNKKLKFLKENLVKKKAKYFVR